MIMSDVSYYTIEGLKKLKDELSHLKDIERPKASNADLKSGKISVSSPIGKGLLGKKVGEVAEVIVPNGTLRFEIISINR